jgi:DNA invertase Pin-like site-specific DNA recombinase
MVFTVRGAVAALQRGLIVERVKAALRNAKATAKGLGRLKVSVDAVQIVALRRWPIMERNRQRDGLDERDGAQTFHGQNHRPSLPNNL